MSDEQPVRIILSTVGTEAAAEDLARRWVESRRAACVSIVPGVRSIYRWKGEVCDDVEALLILKTSVTNEDECQRLLASLAQDHPYEQPEFLVLDPVGGAPGYLAWVRENSGS